MPQANCFDAPTLKDYLLGKLSDEQSNVVAAHLEACLACEATVSQLDRASDTLTNGLRLPAVAAESKIDDELQEALEKVQSLEKLANHPTFEVSKTSEVSADRSPLLRDYRLLEPLGSGGMGTVYKAVHTRLDRLVAVKLLPARRLGDEQAVARFQREMRVIGQLSHPAIVQATDAGEVDGTHFLVMEFVEGFDLNTIAKACGPLSMADACEIARQAALGLEYAHQQGIVHRDIKPSNLMLSRGEGLGLMVEGQTSASALPSTFNPQPSTCHIKILDLGLALLSGEQAPVDELTTVGQLMGTLDYMAPEQLEDSHLVGPRADVYALAATLYRLLTGVAPFAKDNRKTPLQKLRALATQAAPPIRERRADLPEDLAAIIDRALRRDSAERFASMAEFAEALAPWCAGHDLSQLVGQVSNLPGSAVESLSAWRGPPGPRRADDPRRALDGQVENLPHVSQPRRWLLTTLAMLFLAAVGLVITVETNKGTLIVESLRDGVEVRVKKSGKTVEQLELTTGPKSARLASGDYEIEIVGEADGLQIQNGKFVLKRGDTVVAKVTEIPKGQVATDKPAFVAEPTTDSPPRKPVEIVDRNAKGMETFEASNPDLAAEKKVREALQKSIEVNFADNPLTDTLRFLEDKTQITFFLETEALLEEGLAPDTPITLSLFDKPTTTILEFLLRPIQCAWYIDGGQVVITTASKEKQVFVTRTYPVGKLLPGVKQAVERLRSEPQPPAGQPAQGGGGFGGGFFRVGDASSLAGTLTATLGQFGGGGGAAPAANPPPLQPVIPTDASHFQSLLSESLGYAWSNLHGEGGTCELLHNVLVVRHTRRAHADVESLLRTVEAAFLKPLTEPVEIRPAGYSLEADTNVRQQLARKLDVAFTETPLADTAAWLSDQLGVPVLLDHKALTEEGIATDTPVTLQFQGIAGDVLLSRLLRPLQLDYDIEHGLLILTTASKQKERLVTKVYDVRDLLDRGLHPSRLIAGLQTTTPGPWLATDGEGGSLTLFADTLLIVRQTWPSHDEVAKFLASLRSQLSDQPEIPRVVKSNPQSTAPDNSATPRPNQPQPNIPATADNPPTKPASDNQPRYDGKTFNEWLAVLDVERSPARLADALEALRLLLDEKRTRTVCEKTLKLFRVVDVNSAWGARDDRRSLSGYLIALLNELPRQELAQAAAVELRSGNFRSRKMVFEIVISNWIVPIAGNSIAEYFGDPALRSEPIAVEVLNLTHDPNAEIRASALWWLARRGQKDLSQGLQQRIQKEWRSTLADKDSVMALIAVQALVDSEADAAAVSEVLKQVISQRGGQPRFPFWSGLRIEALKYAALMGPRAAPAAKAIADVLLEKDDFIPGQGQGGGGVGGGGFFSVPSSGGGFGDGGIPRTQFSRKQLAALALARIGDAAAETIPTIEAAFNKTKPVNWAWAFDDGGVAAKFLDRPSTLAETLLGTFHRLRKTPAEDVSKALNARDSDGLHNALARYKLARDERELLESHYGSDSDHPGLREAKAKEAEERRRLRPEVDAPRQPAPDGKAAKPSF